MLFTSAKKLIVIKSTGDHSNKLQQNLHFEVFCKKHNIEYHNPTFHDMAEFYVEPCKADTNLYYKFLQIDLLGKLFRHSRFVKRVFSVVWLFSKLGFLKFVRFDNTSKVHLCEKYLLDAFNKHNVVYVAGWRFRMLELSETYRTEMAQRYALRPEIYADSAFVDRIHLLKSQGYSLVGVHIRRGDYKTWKDGTYYYDDSVYQNYLDKIGQQYKAKGEEKHKFVLFSDEKITLYNSSNVISSQENWYIDHYVMSLCDHLIGPPSTFTLWASYVGKARLFHIYDTKQEFVI